MKRPVPKPPTVQIDLCTIGEAAEVSGVSAKMIRHYESIGLIPSAARTGSNYRLYSSADLHRLRFIKRARALGFSVKQIGTLLSLWANPTRSSREVKTLAMAHARDLDVRIRQLVEMRDALTDLAQRCHGDGRPNCPILASLADAGTLHSV
jgi:Cu(I)-responsive transcriptional regulator